MHFSKIFSLDLILVIQNLIFGQFSIADLDKWMELIQVNEKANMPHLRATVPLID